MSDSLATATIAAQYEIAERRRRVYSGLVLIFMVVLVIGGVRIAEDANAGGLWSGLPHIFDYPADILGQAYAKGWEFWTIPFTVQHADHGIRHTYFYYLIETLNMALVSTLIGFVLGATLSILASRNLVKNRAIVWVTRRVTDISRAFPEIVIALFLIFIFGKNPIAAVAAIAFHTTGALAKLFSEVNENADMKPWEGLEASGASWLQKIWFGIIPQVWPNWISYALLRLEINVRASAILGFVGAGGLGQQFKTFVDWKFGADIAAIILLLISAIILIDQLSTWARHYFIGKEAH